MNIARSYQTKLSFSREPGKLQGQIRKRTCDPGFAKRAKYTPPPALAPGPAPGPAPGRLRYVKGDLFSCAPSEALAHCISEDCRMGAGIAVLFKKKYGGVQELKAQKQAPGGCAVLKRGGRMIFYLVTKKKASQKPTYEALRQSLQAMKVLCLENGVVGLSMPRIGCGLDRLKWEVVSLMIEEVFCDASVCITVYSL